MLALQQSVAFGAAGAVARQLSLVLATTGDRRRSVDPDVYDLYLRGRFYWNQRTEVSLKQAIDYFEQTITLAPAYAPAYSGIADAYAALVYGCYLAPAEGFPKVRAALQKARELDPQAAEVFASEGYMNMYFDWDFPAAARNLKQAIALNPNYAPAHDWLGVLETAMEDFPAANRTLEHARVLDPGSLPILTDVGFELHYGNQNLEAQEALNRVFRRDPNFPLAHFWMGRVCTPWETAGTVCHNCKPWLPLHFGIGSHLSRHMATSPAVVAIGKQHWKICTASKVSNKRDSSRHTARR
jgi:tetratricopeptide (TPR) repeat protein